MKSLKNYTRTPLLFLFICLFYSACQSPEITYLPRDYGPNKAIKNAGVEKMMVYQTLQENDSLTDDNLANMVFFNEQGCMVTSWSINPYTRDTLQEVLEYNEANQLLKYIVAEKLYPRESVYSYDEKGRLSEIETKSNMINKQVFHYNEKDQMIMEVGYQKPMPNDSIDIEFASTDTTRFVYNKHGQLSDEMYKRGKEMLFINAFQYDKKGMLIAIDQKNGFGESIALIQYTYDKNQLMTSQKSIDQNSKITSFNKMRYAYFNSPSEK